jgi:CHAT domain-containing protein
MAEVVRGAYLVGGIQFPPLPNTRVEVEGIGGLFSPASRKIYLGSSATESSVKQEKLTEYRRLHFATPLSTRGRRPGPALFCLL